LGNRLSGADGFGPAVVERLFGDRLPKNVTLADVHTDLLAHIHRCAEADEVLLIDAVLGEDDGIHLVEETTFSAWDSSQADAHTMSPVAAVKLFRRLYPAAGVRIRLVAYVVSPERFRSAPDEGAVKAAAAFVRWLVQTPARRASSRAASRPRRTTPA
jgi:hydrogenase maturation protease